MAPGMIHTLFLHILHDGLSQSCMTSF